MNKANIQNHENREQAEYWLQRSWMNDNGNIIITSWGWILDKNESER